jgi:hypothetical protein
MRWNQILLQVGAILLLVLQVGAILLLVLYSINMWQLIKQFLLGVLSPY